MTLLQEEQDKERVLQREEQDKERALQWRS
jgi:hypothetical protein